MQCGGYWKSYTCKCSYKSLHSHVAGLHGCYSLLLTMVSVPPWLFDIYLWLFLWICKDNPSPLRSPHRPYCPWLNNRPLMFDLVPTRSNTQRGLRCWPVQWASLPAHDSMTYEIASFAYFGRLNKFNPSIGHFMAFHDISGLVSNWGPLDAWHKSFPTPWFPNTNKIA